MLAANSRQQDHQHKSQKIKHERIDDMKSSNGTRNYDSPVGTIPFLNQPYIEQKSHRKKSRKIQQISENWDNIVQSTMSRCLNNGYNRKTYDPQRRWSRDNIVQTMEHFQPITSPSHPSKCSFYARPPDYEYSYAYYEPGVMMSHSKIPTSEELIRPSQLSSATSTRALLSQTNEKLNKYSPVNRHTYTTHYGTHENIYEDVSIQEPFKLAQSHDEQVCTKTEFQDILNNHYRVLEELNLSVEELLLSSSQSNVSSCKKITKRTLQPSLITEMFSLKLKGNRRSSMNRLVGGEDSGFSDSSSGGSYIGSLRNYKTAITRSIRRSSRNLNASGTFQNCRSDKFPKNSVQGVFDTTNRMDNQTIDSDRKCVKFPFWRKR